MHMYITVMSEISNPFLSADDENCLICGRSLEDDSSLITQNGWPNLQKLAREWSLIILKSGDEYYEFTQVFKKIEGKENAFGKRHRKNKCRVNFSKKTLLDSLRSKQTNVQPCLEPRNSCIMTEDELSTEFSSTLIHNPNLTPVSTLSSPLSSHRTRSITGNTTQFERICFICNVIRPCDQTHQYREGGLGVCEFTRASKRLMKAADLIDESNEFYPAKVRLNILLSGHSKDIYSAEIRYHMSCYKRFTYTRSQTDPKDVIEEKMHECTLNDFLANIDLSIVQRNNAFLLNQLLNDWLSFCMDRDIISRMNHTHHLKNVIMEHFPESIGFFKTGRPIIVYSQFTNPCAYSVSTLRGSGMRDKDIIKSFANMVKRNAKNSKGDVPKFPYSPTELMQGTEKGPMCDLYNVKFMTLHDSMTVNEHGYAITKSKNFACKIWALANDWEALLFRDACYRNPYDTQQANYKLPYEV